MMQAHIYSDQILVADSWLWKDSFQ